MAPSALPAKIARPRLAAVYQRSRLFTLLDAARERCAVTFVSGPPGTGKTTLLSSYIEFRNLRCLWYQVDPGDEDVATFFHYLGRATEPHRAPGSTELPHFTPEFAFGLASFSRQFFRELYAGLNTPFVLVLDNYQEVADTSRLHEVIRCACDEMPEGGHIVLASRHACPQTLARPRANHALTVIGADELSLSIEETRGIAALQGVSLPSEAAAKAMHTGIGGWAAGLILTLQQNGLDNTSRPLHIEPGEAVFDYFAGEVFRMIDRENRSVLIQSALLPKMTPRGQRTHGQARCHGITAATLAQELLHHAAWRRRAGIPIPPAVSAVPTESRRFALFRKGIVRAASQSRRDTSGRRRFGSGCRTPAAGTGVGAPDGRDRCSRASAHGAGAVGHASGLDKQSSGQHGVQESLAALLAWRRQSADQSA